MQDSFIVPVHHRDFHFLPGTFHKNPSTYGTEQLLQTSKNVIFRELTVPLTFVHFCVSNFMFGNEIHNHLALFTKKRKLTILLQVLPALSQSPCAPALAAACAAGCGWQALDQTSSFTRGFWSRHTLFSTLNSLSKTVLQHQLSFQHSPLVGGGKPSSSTLLLCFTKVVRPGASGKLQTLPLRVPQSLCTHTAPVQLPTLPFRAPSPSAHTQLTIHHKEWFAAPGPALCCQGGTALLRNLLSPSQCRALSMSGD